MIVVDRIKKLEDQISRLELRIIDLEATPVIPDVFDPLTNRCSICNIDFSGVMGYVCDNMACPMYPKIGDNFATRTTGG